jgi:membrane protein
MRIYRIYDRVSSEIGRLNIGLIAAGVAFYSLLAIFPALTALIALWGLFADPDEVALQLQTFEPMVPEAAYDIIAGQIRSLASGSSSTLGWASAASIGAALWATRSGVSALIGGLNAAYEIPRRGGLGQMVTAMLLTLALIGIAMVALAAVVLVPVALALLPLGQLTSVLLSAARWIAGVAAVLLGIALLYRFGPNRPARGQPWVSAGSVLAISLWALVSVGFSTYLENFGNYDAVYGSLGAVIALLMWFYLSAFVVMLGALLNAARERVDREETEEERARDATAPRHTQDDEADGPAADGADETPAAPATGV